MQFTNLLTTTFLAGLAAAAPAKRDNAVSMAVTESWALEGFTITMNSDNTAATYSYNISTGSGAVTPCIYTVKGSPANETTVDPRACGPFTVSSRSSKQFGRDVFITLAILNEDEKKIAYPAYTGAELKNGTAVSPDRSYPAQSLPQ